ncbi:Ppx/GppA phosphatase family protein [Paenibacillus sp. IITD108]|uniref:Ppx/GppA phosphatase family protein n=1 Tax=Paenibacillus sp. IITD108 TaxID=3116649 RepID=UPI002F3FCBFE
MGNNHTFGIVDIGSNSIRVAVYEMTSAGEYRLIHENKESARLSQKINADGKLYREDLISIMPILQQFHHICLQYKCRDIRVAATAAIRNASNSQEIANSILKHTGLQVQILSGEQEAYYGFLGVVSNIEYEDGFIIDIGGGSTEVTLFRGRRLLHSISLPIGAVNGHASCGKSPEAWTEHDISSLTKKLEQLLAQHSWIMSSPGLPLIGLGGTIRALSKLDQHRANYPLKTAHHYKLDPNEIQYFAQLLPSLPLAKRKQLDGLSKSRSDIIAPGVIILNTIMAYIQASSVVVSGTGLREGMLIEAAGLGVPAAVEVIPRQTRSLLAFHSTARLDHLLHVYKLAIRLLDAFAQYAAYPQEYKQQAEKLLYVSAMLYKIGGSIHYHQYDKHTLYWLTNAPIAGLTHREALLCANIAAAALGKAKASSLAPYRNLLEPADAELIAQIGSLLHIAIALNISETGAVEDIVAEIKADALQLELFCSKQALLETRGLEAAVKPFKKAWKLGLKWNLHLSR